MHGCVQSLAKALLVLLGHVKAPQCDTVRQNTVFSFIQDLSCPHSGAN
ncbi:hypothetical protein ATPR_0819 [Acetobacter tropicalis NBRC 101654]|uniref:Uncharacterized protein n=1 Tax=Acetobacter tropicalis NBRC 101654 TaxID=749388 RepID=F7VBS0_9PROT|nr:hypothetical protein ATPR_0819 [Acetobacter tropicalis NBRC 101654]